MGRDARKYVGATAVAASFISGLGTVVGLSVGSLLRFGGYSMYASARKKGKAERQEGTCFSVASTTGGL
ncbi:MAG: hypothetical protein KAX80_11635, partial [Planctomycetes bacterium]|nr:hypothetical protein [Planctomycetota bacterium]